VPYLKEVIKMINVLSVFERNELIQISENISKEDLIRFFTLTKFDLINANRYRSDSSRLGFAIQVCILRYKGWPLNYINSIPNAIINFIAEQLRIPADSIDSYWGARKKNTIFDHFKDIKNLYNYNIFSEDSNNDINIFIDSLLEKTDNAYFIVLNCIKKLKNLNVVLPAIYKIEKIVGEARSRNEIKVINKLNEFLNDDQRKKIDILLESYGESVSYLAWLRDDIGKPSTETFLNVIKRFEMIDDIKLNLSLHEIPSYKIEQFVRLGKRYEPFSLRRFEDKKRHAIMSAYLMDLKQSLIDKAIVLHDLKMNAIFGKIKNHQLELIKKQRKVIKEVINDYVLYGKKIIAANEGKKDVGKTIENEITWEKFKQSVQDAEEVSIKTKKNTLDMLNKYYGELRKYTPVLLKTLSFESTSNTCKELVDAIDVVKNLNNSKKINLPDETEINFVNKTWKSYIERKVGSEKRHYYEIAVLNELKNKVRSGDISVAGSKSFKSFEDYLVSEKDWELERNQTKLTVQETFKEYISAKKQELNTLLKWYSKNYDTLNEIIGEDDKIHLKRLEANTPPEAEILSQNLYKMIPKISLQEIVFEVMKMTSFHKHFIHAVNQQPLEDPEEIKLLIFAIMGIGTNVGLSKIAESLNNISYKQLVHMSDWRIYDDNLQNAQAEMVNYQLKEPFTNFWGDGTTSSSDGMRINTIDSINAGFSHKLGLKKIITLHKFLNDKYSTFFVTASSPGDRDGIHVIDGLTRHRSELTIKEHYTDTAGYTDQVFALTSLMGFRFAPRIRNLPDLKLYMLDNKDTDSKLLNLVKGRINEKLIEKNYNDILRLAHSIREQKVTSSLILGKLGSYSRNNALANALKELGRIEKTIFILEYASNPQFRRRIQVGLNKGEEAHGLARVVFFGRRGQFWERELQEQLQKASCLNILVNATVIWNTKYLTKAWKVYKENHPDADENLLKHISPLNWEHINFLGMYFFDKDVEFENDNLRKLNIN
jgi:TnpA family transposase